MAAIKKLRSGATPPSRNGESVITSAAQAISLKRDGEGRVYVNCGPNYYEEGATEQSRYTGKLTKKGY